MYKTTTENGKYEFVNDNGVPKVYRNGELQEKGSKAWLTLLQKVESLEEYKNDVDELFNDVQYELQKEKQYHIQEMIADFRKGNR
jgi:hypothetical protein